jgi:hypothetical protein
MNSASFINSFNGLVTTPFDLLTINQRGQVGKAKLIDLNPPLSTISIPVFFLPY